MLIFKPTTYTCTTSNQGSTRDRDRVAENFQSPGQSPKDPGFFYFESRSRIPDFLILPPGPSPGSRIFQISVPVPVPDFLMRPGPSPGSQIFQISVPVRVPDPANFEFESRSQSRILK